MLTKPLGMGAVSTSISFGKSNPDHVAAATATMATLNAGGARAMAKVGCHAATDITGFEDWICIRTYHDGYHDFPELMLFDLSNDPHETRDLARSRPEIVVDAMAKLEGWYAEMARTALRPGDPMQTVLAEGGPFHTRGQLAKYLDRLRSTDRERWARALEARHAAEI